MQIFEIELTTMGNVHIGNGVKISKYEYVYDNVSRQYKIVDIRNLFKYAIEHNKANEYFEFISKATKNTRNKDWNLYQFLEKNFSNAKFIVDSFCLYKIDCCDSGRFEDIDCFIKDKMTNKPYIPGSSIKGIIANALYFDLAKRLEQTGDVFDDKSQVGDIIENVLKCVLRGIFVSDSELIDIDKLSVDKVYYFNASKNKFTELPQKYEVLKKGTKAKCTITIDTRKMIYEKGQEGQNDNAKKVIEFTNNVIDFIVKNISINYLSNILKSYYNLYYKYYLSKFSCKDKFAIENVEDDAVKIYVGAKTGFPNKTIYYQIYKEQAYERVFKILKERFSKTTPIKPSASVFPVCLKTAKIGGQYCEMGAVKLKFKEVQM
ncbi:MAG: type III-A CRISPR-associated RAMP protein Csm5 [Christensenellales bacterium]